MKILVVAPHGDDGEIGCGATIARYVEKGHRVFYITFASNDPNLLELKAALKVLNVWEYTPETNLFYYPIKIREFGYHRQEILDFLVDRNQALKPDLVFVPSFADTHQDHKVIAVEGFRAFKNTSLLGYEVPWNNISFNTDFFVEINESHLKKKFEAMFCHESQRDRHYVSGDFVGSLARVRGIQIGVKFAESFEVMRQIQKL